MMQPTTRQLRTHTDLYKTFPLKDQLTGHEFRLILKYFHNLLRKSIIYEGKIYTLPYHLGFLGILSRFPIDNKIRNYQHYKETGQKVNRLNLHSQGRTARVHRIITVGTLTTEMYPAILRAFKFEACRSMNREMTKAITNENTMALYLEYELRKH